MHYDYKKLAACSALLLFCASAADAKYCVKIPSCEDLGYIYDGESYKNSRTLKCPFDANYVMLLDYCQAYPFSGDGISAQMNVRGETDECQVKKAGSTAYVPTGYYRFTRCNEGYIYQSGDCVRLYTIARSELNATDNASCRNYDKNDGSAAGEYCKCDEGFEIKKRYCMLPDCNENERPADNFFESDTSKLSCHAHGDTTYCYCKTGDSERGLCQ